MSKSPSNFIAFILTHKRPDNVITVKSLRNAGYTGPIHFLVDNDDPTADEYKENFGKENVTVFDKKSMADKTDEGDNFNIRTAIIHARNACYEIAEKLGYKYFIQLDDDYTGFEYRVYDRENGLQMVHSLDEILCAMLEFYKSTPTQAIAMAQGGEYIGGKANRFASNPTLLRKAMNSFICSTDRPIKFIGRMNEDVNAYVVHGATGMLFFTFVRVSLGQLATQSNPGGLTERYLESGTYVKSFYTVMMHPSSVKVGLMGSMDKGRLHHKISWKHTVPKILRESVK